MITRRPKTIPTALVMIPASAMPCPGEFFFFAIIPVIIPAIPKRPFGMPKAQQQNEETIARIPRTSDTIASTLLPS